MIQPDTASRYRPPAHHTSWSYHSIGRWSAHNLHSHISCSCRPLSLDSCWNISMTWIQLLAVQGNFSKKQEQTGRTTRFGWRLPGNSRILRSWTESCIRLIRWNSSGMLPLLGSWVCLVRYWLVGCSSVGIWGHWLWRYLGWWSHWIRWTANCGNTSWKWRSRQSRHPWPAWRHSYPRRRSKLAGLIHCDMSGSCSKLQLHQCF